MYPALKSIRRERARLERDRVLIGSMIKDGQFNEAFMDLDKDFFESASDDEIEALLDKIPESDAEDEEIERILASTGSLTVDDILNIEEDEPDLSELD